MVLIETKTTAQSSIPMRVVTHDSEDQEDQLSSCLQAQNQIKVQLMKFYFFSFFLSGSSLESENSVTMTDI